MKKYQLIYFSFLVMFTGVLLSGCKKFVSIDPPIQYTVSKEIYKTDAGAASVITGIYSSMTQTSFVHGMTGLALYTGLSSDELILDNASTDPNLLYTYQNNNNKALGNFFWRDIYAFVYRVNAAIEGIKASEDLSVGVRNQLLGEAYFVRAYLYFHLVNFYGDVPLLLTTDPEFNSKAPRESADRVYNQMIADLNGSLALINEGYVAGDATTVSNHRVRPNKTAVFAFLARVYLYKKEWQLAELAASAVIDNSDYSLVPLNQVFLVNSAETIWSLQVRSTLEHNKDGNLFNLLAADGRPNPDAERAVYINNRLLSIFDAEDKRLVEWVSSVASGGMTYFFPHKYKTDITTENITENVMMLRVAEQYLIRAEARAMLNKLSGLGSAEADVNEIRLRAGLTNAVINSQDEALLFIDAERQKELFTEGGHRWFDLKRRGLVNNIMPEVCQEKEGTWQPFKALYPIPVDNILANPALRSHQNEGYPEQ